MSESDSVESTDVEELDEMSEALMETGDGSASEEEESQPTMAEANDMLDEDEPVKGVDPAEKALSYKEKRAIQRGW